MVRLESRTNPWRAVESRNEIRKGLKGIYSRCNVNPDTTRSARSQRKTQAQNPHPNKGKSNTYIAVVRQAQALGE